MVAGSRIQRQLGCILLCFSVFLQICSLCSFIGTGCCFGSLACVRDVRHRMLLRVNCFGRGGGGDDGVQVVRFVMIGNHRMLLAGTGCCFGSLAWGHLLACAMCATGCCFGSIASVCDVGMGLGVEGGVQVVRFVVTGNHRMFNPRLLCLYAACPSMAMALGRHWRRKLEPVDGEYIFEELTNDIHMAQNKRAKAATQSCVSLQVCVLLWP